MWLRVCVVVPQALALRSCCAEIVNTMTQPIPFPYYHTLTLMLSLNLYAAISLY